ncbi:aldo/keto reductase [Actinomadura hibisca]|uniref:aldo/keto reductase n=1 Tax=Actinomadura hibisca TaxID=68565 RepID=UPI000AC76CBC|nr:aldo/keto reductase [Actinomadura hibisca]
MSGPARLDYGALGFGAAAIGNLYTAVSDQDAAEAVHAAREAGVRYFDTAPHYGLGLSERRLGAALRDCPRDSYVLSTKVGRVLVPSDAGGRDEGFDVPATHRRVIDYSADGVRRSLADSLERLGLDRVDLVLIHDPEEGPEAAADQAYPALRELRDQGVIGAIGAGSKSWEVLADLVRRTELDMVMPAGRYTLLEQPALAGLFPLCAERGTEVIAAGVFNSGLLATDEPAADAFYDYEAAPPELVERARRTAAVARRHGVTLPQAALAFPATHPVVAGIVVGARTAAEVRRNAELMARPVPGALWAELAAEGLLGPEVPLPGE